VLPRRGLAVVPPAVPLVDDVLSGATLLDLLLSLESAVLAELQTTHHDHLLVLLLRGEQGFDIFLGRQGCARVRRWGPRHRSAGQHLLEMVSRDCVYLDGHRCSLSCAGASFLVSARFKRPTLPFSLVLPKLVVSLETTTVPCNSTTAASP